jgi:dienelactone hydrolase
MFRLLALCSFLLIALPVFAQENEDTTYTDPLFSVPIPDGWTNASEEGFGHFISPDGAVNLYAFALVDGDAQALAVRIIPEFEGSPVQSSPVPLGMLTWTQDIYVLASGELLVVVHYTDEAGVIYALGILAEQSQFAGVTPVLNDMLLNFVINSVDSSVPPAPYDVPANYTEQDVTIVTDRWELGGTLLMPVGEGTFPAVVIVHGSGPNDRDGTMMGVNKPYRDLAQGLASNGIAVLRYDKRTYVYGTDSADDFIMATIADETITDALSAIALLRDTPNIDPNRIFVIGHSMGGMFAPELARLDGALAGAILMAGNSRSLLEVTLAQFDYLQALPINASASAQATINQMREETQQILTLSADADPNQTLLGVYVTYWLDLMAYNQIETAQNLTTPMLILQGERDYQVTMEDFALWQSSLADKPDVTFISYPALNHLFLVGEGASTPTEYGIPSHIPEEVINDIVTWIER